MEQEIERAIRTTLVVMNKQSIGIAVKKIMDVIEKDKKENCEHPYAFVLEGEPQKCLSCGKILSD